MALSPSARRIAEFARRTGLRDGRNRAPRSVQAACDRRASRSLQCGVPSPVGHVLGGVAAGWLVAGRHRDPDVRAPGWLPHVAARWWREGAVFGALGAAPDLDLLVGAHSTYTHSVGAAAIVAALAYVLRGR